MQMRIYVSTLGIVTGLYRNAPGEVKGMVQMNDIQVRTTHITLLVH
jgi:hypothetical protein